MTDLHSKKTLIIGGSRGIGAAIVRRFVQDGAHVAFTYSGSHDAAQARIAMHEHMDRSHTRFNVSWRQTKRSKETRP